MLTIETNVDELLGLGKVLRETGNQAPHAIRRAVNWVGDKAATQVTRALAKQTSAKYGAVRKALRRDRANYGRMVYRIVATGAHIPLRDFGARQTRKGVSAMVWGKRRVFPHLFIVAPRGGGQVFARVGKGRLPITKRWGPALPLELVKDATAAVFLETVRLQLPDRVGHEINAILQGYAPRG
jgi:hypothetical protein